ncbi:hypothetical protein WMY93_015653 [Mugilogobius chulae]|uniref:DRBM domain-containing protein n=1 Tax=Mugilogobius chulae TaxID=88201 RepID=A0AAW0P1P6_9GOBI
MANLKDFHKKIDQNYKNEICEAFELADKHHLQASWERMSQDGPHGHCTFTYRLTVGEHSGIGQGQTVYQAKLQAAKNILPDLRLISFPNEERRGYGKKKRKNHTKELPEITNMTNPITYLDIILTNLRGRYAEYSILSVDKETCPPHTYYVMQLVAAGETVVARGKSKAEAKRNAAAKMLNIFGFNFKVSEPQSEPKVPQPTEETPQEEEICPATHDISTQPEEALPAENIEPIVECPAGLTQEEPTTPAQDAPLQDDLLGLLPPDVLPMLAAMGVIKQTNDGVQWCEPTLPQENTTPSDMTDNADVTQGDSPEEPATEEPATEEPAPEEPATEEPAIEEPAIEESATEEPAPEELAPQEPATEEPAPEEPAPEEPTTEEPATEEPAIEEPAPEEPAPEEPTTEEPAPQEPAIEEPAPEKPVPEEPTTEEPAPQEPAIEEPAPEEPATEEPALNEPATEEPATEELAPQKPATEEPAPEEPAPEEPAPEEPATEEPAPEELAPQEPTTEEPAPEEPAPEEPTTEEPATEEPVPEAPVPQEPATEEPVPEAPVPQEPAIFIVESPSEEPCIVPQEIPIQPEEEPKNQMEVTCTEERPAPQSAAARNMSSAEASLLTRALVRKMLQKAGSDNFYNFGLIVVRLQCQIQEHLIVDGQQTIRLKDLEKTGKKTAKHLIEQYGSADEVLSALQEPDTTLEEALVKHLHNELRSFQNRPKSTISRFFSRHFYNDQHFNHFEGDLMGFLENVFKCVK